VAGRGPELELRVAGGPELQEPVLVAIVKFDARDRLGMAAIEAFSQPQQGRELTDDTAPLAGEIAEVDMIAFGRRTTMIPCRERDDVHFMRFEAAQIAVLDEVERMLVMAFVADVDADVVQDRRVLEPLPLFVRHRVDAARLVEEPEGEPRDLLRVLGPVVAALGQLDDAAAPDVGVAIGLRDLLPVARDVVEDETLA
jgi:hypothetical protein